MEENGISRDMLYQGTVYAILIFMLLILLCKFSFCRTRPKRPLLIPVQPKNMITNDTIDRKPRNYDNLDPYERNVFRKLDDLPSQQLDRSGHQDDDIENRKPIKTKLERLPFYYESDYERSITTTRNVETKGFHKF